MWLYFMCLNNCSTQILLIQLMQRWWYHANSIRKGDDILEVQRLNRQPAVENNRKHSARYCRGIYEAIFSHNREKIFQTTQKRFNAMFWPAWASPGKYRQNTDGLSSFWCAVFVDPWHLDRSDLTFDYSLRTTTARTSCGVLQFLRFCVEAVTCHSQLTFSCISLLVAALLCGDGLLSH